MTAYNETEYILGAGGEQVTEMSKGINGSMKWEHTNVFAGGKLLATYDVLGLHFYLDDALGSRRVQTNYDGVVEQTCASLPFGDQLSCSGSNMAPTEHHFTGKERDAESGNDYFGARYYNSNMGRFLSPDWSAKIEPVPYSKLDNPQSLNLYAYVMNNPLTTVDPDGHLMIPPDADTGFQAPDTTFDPRNGKGKGPGDSPDGPSTPPPAQQQNGTTTTPGDPSRLTQPNPDTVIPGSPSQQRERVYQATDKDGNPITTPCAQIMENAKVTKVTPGYAIDPQTSNGKWINANPGPGQFTDRLGPDSRDKTATYSYTTRQSFQIKIGDTVYPLSTVVRNQITVVGGVVTSIKTTFITP